MQNPLKPTEQVQLRYSEEEVRRRWAEIITLLLGEIEASRAAEASSSPEDDTQRPRQNAA